MGKLEPSAAGPSDFDPCDHFAVTEDTLVTRMSVPGNTALVEPGACCRAEYRGFQAEIRGQA